MDCKAVTKSCWAWRSLVCNKSYIPLKTAEQKKTAPHSASSGSLAPSLFTFLNLTRLLTSARCLRNTSLTGSWPSSDKIRPDSRRRENRRSKQDILAFTKSAATLKKTSLICCLLPGGGKESLKHRESEERKRRLTHKVKCGGSVCGRPLCVIPKLPSINQDRKLDFLSARKRALPPHPPDGAALRAPLNSLGTGAWFKRGLAGPLHIQGFVWAVRMCGPAWIKTMHLNVTVARQRQAVATTDTSWPTHRKKNTPTHFQFPHFFSKIPTAN